MSLLPLENVDPAEKALFLQAAEYECRLQTGEGDLPLRVQALCGVCEEARERDGERGREREREEEREQQRLRELMEGLEVRDRAEEREVIEGLAGRMAGLEVSSAEEAAADADARDGIPE